MMLEQVALVAQIVGVIVVAATLIFLTIQVRQSAEILRSETRQTQLENDQTGVYKFVEYPELGRIFSQTEKPSFDDKTKAFFWVIGQMRAREYEWLQYKSGAMDKEAWETYREVIYFVLGTRRSRDMWAICSAYFNSGFVEEVRNMTDNAPEIDLWEKLEDMK